MSLDPALHRLPSPIHLYRSRRPKKRLTFWRMLAWMLAVCVLLIGAAAAGAYYWALSVTDELTHTQNVDDRRAQSVLQQIRKPATDPAIALLIGYDRRYGAKAGSGNSDTLILVRIDPVRKTLTTLAIPRDLRVDIPGVGYAKINAAYANGGAPLALKTVSALIGRPINYYVPVNFRAFRDTVEAVHGVYLDVDRRYLHTNDGYNDYAVIDIKAGYRKLNGLHALEYVRNRHDDTDFMRNARQQAFLRELKRRLDVSNVGTGVVDLVNALKKNVKLLPATGQSLSLEQLYRYGTLLSSIPRKSLVQLRIEGGGEQISGVDYVVASPEQIAAQVQAFLDPHPGSSRVIGRQLGGKRIVKAGTKAVRPIAPAKLAVVTINGSGADGIATIAAAGLRKAGWSRALRAGNTAPVVGSTRIYYAGERAKKSAERLRLVLGKTETPRPMPARRGSIAADGGAQLARAQVVVVIGAAFVAVDAQASSAGSDVDTSPAQTQAAGTVDLPRFRALQKRLGYPLLYPARVPLGSRYEEPIVTADDAFSAYRLRKQWAGHVTGYAGGSSFRSTSKAWGIQYMRWTSAPILDESSDEPQCVGGRVFRLYANGGQLHRVAIYYGGTRCTTTGYVTWIDNSLDNTLSPATMIAIAKSMRPIPAGTA